jgi:hypothetical protein
MLNVKENLCSQSLDAYINSTKLAYLACDLWASWLLSLLGVDQSESNREDQEEGQKKTFEIHSCSQLPGRVDFRQ